MFWMFLPAPPPRAGVPSGSSAGSSALCRRKQALFIYQPIMRPLEQIQPLLVNEKLFLKRDGMEQVFIYFPSGSQQQSFRRFAASDQKFGAMIRSAASE